MPVRSQFLVENDVEDLADRLACSHFGHEQDFPFALFEHGWKQLHLTLPEEERAGGGAQPALLEVACHVLQGFEHLVGLDLLGDARMLQRLRVKNYALASLALALGVRLYILVPSLLGVAG